METLSLSLLLLCHGWVMTGVLNTILFLCMQLNACTVLQKILRNLTETFILVGHNILERTQSSEYASGMYQQQITNYSITSIIFLSSFLSEKIYMHKLTPTKIIIVNNITTYVNDY